MPSAASLAHAGPVRCQASAYSSQQQGVVVEHPLVVGLAPVAARGVAEEPAVDRVAEGRRRHPFERSDGEVDARLASQQKTQDRRDREFGLGAEAAEHRVLGFGERGDRVIQCAGAGEVGDLGDGR